MNCTTNTLFIILILLSHKDNRSPYCSWLRALQPASLFSPPRSSPTHHKSIGVKYLNPLPIRKTIIWEILEIKLTPADYQSPPQYQKYFCSKNTSPLPLMYNVGGCNPLSYLQLLISGCRFASGRRSGMEALPARHAEWPLAELEYTTNNKRSSYMCF